MRYWFLIPLLMMVIWACQSVDAGLASDFGAFSPQWATLGKQIVWVEMALKKCRPEVETASQTYLPLLEAPEDDSLGALNLEKEIKRFKKFPATLDSISAAIDDLRLDYEQDLEEYNALETTVLQGNADPAQARKQLEQYRERHASYSETASALRTALKHLAETHNVIVTHWGQLTELSDNCKINLPD